MSGRLNVIATRYFWLIVVGLVLSAFAVRVYQLDMVNLRGDEAYSAVHWTATPFTERWEKLWREEPAPVGAFTMFWLWDALAGDSEFALRYLSLLGNVVGLAVVVALGKRLFNDWTLALMAGALWAIHPFLIWHAQDARVYGVMSALTPLTFYLLIRTLEQDNNARFRVWLPYIFVQTLALYIYYLEPFWMLAQGLYVLTLWRTDLLRRAMRAWVMIGVLIIPVLAQLYTLLFVSAYQGNAEASDFSLLLTWFTPTLFFGDNRIPVWAGAIVIVAIGTLFALIWRRNRRTGTLLALWVFVPVTLLYGASFFSSFFRPRYVMTIIPALVLTIPAGIALLPIKRRTLAIISAVVIVGGVSSVEVYDYFVNDPPKAPDWVSLMAYLNTQPTADDTIIFGQPDPGIEYYYQGTAEVVILPLDWYETDWQPNVDHLINSREALYVTADPRTGDTRAYLQANSQAIPGDAFNLAQFRAWTVDPDEIMTPMALNFADIATLQGYTLIESSTLILYWEALATTTGDYSILLHIESAPDAPPVAVLDHAIAGAVISTQSWTPQALYRDPVTLPDLPAGTYTVLLGIKDTTGTPLALNDAPDGRLPVLTFTVD